MGGVCFHRHSAGGGCDSSVPVCLHFYIPIVFFPSWRRSLCETLFYLLKLFMIIVERLSCDWSRTRTPLLFSFKHVFTLFFRFWHKKLDNRHWTCGGGRWFSFLCQQTWNHEWTESSLFLLNQNIQEPHVDTHSYENTHCVNVTLKHQMCILTFFFYI